MARSISLKCPHCGSQAQSRKAFHCCDCDAVMEAHVEIGHLRKADFDAMRQSKDPSIWRWFDFFPVEYRSSIVSLGEGSTPLIPAGRLGAWADLPNLFLKNDTVLPSGSLKDRSNSVGISVAKELGFNIASVMSTGNAAASVAAYAAAAGMRSVVMVPDGTARSKIIQAQAYGATVIVVQGDFDHEVAALYRAALDEFGWYDCLSSNPYRTGKKSYAFEFVDQLEGRVPDWVIHPTAGGTGIYFIWKAFQDLLSLGWTDRLPKLVVAQSAMAAPIVAAFEQNLPRVAPVRAGETLAESIRVGNPAALGDRALAAVRQSGGWAVAVSEAQIEEAQTLTARLSGVFAEPSAVVSVAAAKALRAASVIGREDLVVCNITGHGLKQPEAISTIADRCSVIAADIQSLRRELRKFEIS